MLLEPAMLEGKHLWLSGINDLHLPGSVIPIVQHYTSGNTQHIRTPKRQRRTSSNEQSFRFSSFSPNDRDCTAWKVQACTKDQVRPDTIAPCMYDEQQHSTIHRASACRHRWIDLAANWPVRFVSSTTPYICCPFDVCGLLRLLCSFLHREVLYLSATCGSVSELRPQDPYIRDTVGIQACSVARWHGWMVTTHSSRTQQ